MIGTSVCCYGGHTWLRTIAPFYPIVMALTVVGTANHWILDCVVGVCVVITGWYLNWIMLGFRGIEEWTYWLARTEKPRDPDATVRESRLED
jgi:hypothetical protein